MIGSPRPPKLFPSAKARLVDFEGAPCVSTPLGRVEFHLALDETELPFGGRAYEGDAERTVFRFDSGLLVAEVLRRPVHPFLPEGMSVDACWGLVCRIQPDWPCGSVDVSTKWGNGFCWTQGGVDGGERLAAMTWSDTKTQVSIGTEDGERFLARAGSPGMPARLQRYLKKRGDQVVTYTPSGLHIRLPSLEPGEFLQVHFIVAWAAEGPQNASPWFAVDVDAEQLMHDLTPSGVS